MATFLEAVKQVYGGDHWYLMPQGRVLADQDIVDLTIVFGEIVEGRVRVRGGYWSFKDRYIWVIFSG